MVFFKLFRDPVGTETDAFMPEHTDGWTTSERSEMANTTLTITNEAINHITDYRRVIPNPATEFITIAPSLDSRNNITIYDLVGTIALDLQNTVSVIDVSNISSGIYYIKIKNEPHVLTFEKINK